jgi:hypothetical protein
MTTDKTTEPAIPRTSNAHEALVGSRPDQQVPLVEWLAYHERSVALNADIAEIDRGHHESNPMKSGSPKLNEPVTASWPGSISYSEGNR